MNAADLQPLPKVLLGPHPPGQPDLNLASEGVQQYVWQSTFGAMLIEVKNGAAYVNGQRVTPIQELREHDRGRRFAAGVSGVARAQPGGHHVNASAGHPKWEGSLIGSVHSALELDAP